MTIASFDPQKLFRFKYVYFQNGFINVTFPSFKHGYIQWLQSPEINVSARKIKGLFIVQIPC